MPRIARIVAEDYPHHIIQRGNNRETVFLDDNDRETYLKLLSKYSRECGCRIHSYCLMNNHIHLLIVPLNKDSLANMMQKLSLRYTQLFNKKYKRTGRLWECRFHSCLIDREEYLWAVCRYIETNPVRAHIVTSAEKYLWSSARFNMLGGDSYLIGRIWKTEKERLEYRNFVLESADRLNINTIRKMTYSGKPLGKQPFLREMEQLLNVDLSEKRAGRPAKEK